jgi:hypothetical protein
VGAVRADLGAEDELTRPGGSHQQDLVRQLDATQEWLIDEPLVDIVTGDVFWITHTELRVERGLFPYCTMTHEPRMQG